MDKRIIDLICGSNENHDAKTQPITTKKEIDKTIHDIYRKFLRLSE